MFGALHTALAYRDARDTNNGCAGTNLGVPLHWDFTDESDEESSATLKKKFIFVSVLFASLTIWRVTANDNTTKITPANMHKITTMTATFSGDIAWIETSALLEPTATLIGIHGTPGSWTAWRNLMKQPDVMQQYNFLAFDRPGWGQSQSQPQLVYPALTDQAEILASVITGMELTPPIILVAHSWGGPVALELAAQFPNLVDGMVLIASPASPVESKPRWYHKAAKSKMVQFAIGDSMSRSNLEMLALETELFRIADRLPFISQPTVIMQGKKDWLVNPENAFYLQRTLTNAPVKLIYDLKGNHFIPFSKPDEVADAIGWVVEQLTP